MRRSTTECATRVLLPSWLLNESVTRPTSHSKTTEIKVQSCMSILPVYQRRRPRAQLCRGLSYRLMVNLLHEIWIEPDNKGHPLEESCCLAGPDGDGLRGLLAPTARLVHTFWAGSHFEAMTIYHRYLGREPYTTDHDWDYSPYPMEWLERQRSVS